MTTKRVLITGGAGYLGSHLADLLNDRCIVLDSLLYANEYFKQVTFARCDVTDYARLKTYLDQVDCVVWLAAIVGDAACMVNPRKAIQVNQEAVRFLAQNFDGPIIFTSTCSVYGVSEEIATESSPLNPKSLYGETKIQAERWLLEKNALILRLGTLHGVSERMRFDLVVNVLTMKAVLNGSVDVFGGRQYRPLLSVKEAAEFIARMVDRDWEPGAYNLASENLSILEVASLVKAELPNVRVNIIEAPFEDTRNYRVDWSKAERKLGFTPRRFARDSVREIAQVIRSGRIKDFSDLKFANLTAIRNVGEGA